VTENKVIIKRTAIKGVVRVKLGTCKAVFSVTDVKGGDNLIKRFNPLFNGSSVKFIRFFKSRFYIFQFGFPLCQPTQGRQRKMDRPTTYWFGAAKLRTGVRKAILPPLVKSSSQRNQSLYDGSFAVIGPRLWNIVPKQFHSVADPLQFKIKLTEFLNTIPDKPPVSGYKYANTNSLLEWNENILAAKLEGRSDYLMTL